MRSFGIYLGPHCFGSNGLFCSKNVTFVDFKMNNLFDLKFRAYEYGTFVDFHIVGANGVFVLSIND